MNPWLIVLIAGLMETGWAIGLKYSDGFTRFWPSLGTLIGAIAQAQLHNQGLEQIHRLAAAAQAQAHTCLVREGLKVA